MIDLGIDLGTTNSAVAGRVGNQFKVFKTADGTDTLPSVIHVDRRGRRLFGMRAYAQASAAPENVAAGFKRLMGTSTPVELPGAGVSLCPEECSAEILKQLVAQALLESGEKEVGGCVITVPAAFNQMQSEATLKAARMADLGKVALLQEPIAAAMAAMAGSQSKSGQFLVYDIGGGTFDLALVQSLNGTVTIIDHEGINMLGGRDFDRAIVNGIVRPWLMQNFDLPEAFQNDPAYRRIIRIAFWKAEVAKIALSSKESETIIAYDNEVGVRDRARNDVSLEIEITREQLEALVEDRLKETLDICRKLIQKTGYSHEDIDRIVFIGGPSKMPWIRERVPAELAIRGDLATDPMTAVALGAAIFCESRDWSGAATTMKATRATTTVRGPVKLRLDYQSRVSADAVRIRVCSEDSSTKGEIQIDGESGWTSGRLSLDGEASINISLPRMGRNAFRLHVFDSSGHPVPEASQEIEVERTHAAASGIPSTKTIAIKVAEGMAEARNTLEPLIRKGTPLPASGEKRLRSMKALKAGEAGHLDFELYEQPDGVTDPAVCLQVGAFRVAGSDLTEGLRINQQDSILFNWSMDDSGILKATVELPSVGQSFNTPKFYVPQAGHHSFEGEEGERLAEDAVEQAKNDLEGAREALGGGAAIDEIGKRIERQEDTLAQAIDADTRRSVSEETLRLRQELSRIANAPENRLKTLSAQLSHHASFFNDHLRRSATDEQRSRYDLLHGTAIKEIGRGDPGYDSAELAFQGMKEIGFAVSWVDPDFLLLRFRRLTNDRHFSVDKKVHDDLVRKGEAAVKGNDGEGLRNVLIGMYANMATWGSEGGSLDIASITRA